MSRCDPPMDVGVRVMRLPVLSATIRGQSFDIASVAQHAACRPPGYRIRSASSCRH